MAASGNSNTVRKPGKPSGPQPTKARSRPCAEIKIRMPKTRAKPDPASKAAQNQQMTFCGHIFNSTMDLRNNDVGMATNHQVSGVPDYVAIKADLTQKYATGEMYIWERPAGRDVGQVQSEGIIVKSNLSRVYP